MKVIVRNKQRNISISSSSVKRAVACVIQHLSVRTDVVYVYFLGERALARLHDQLFQDPSLTDTITVPIDAPGEEAFPHILGEIFIDPKDRQKMKRKENFYLSMLKKSDLILKAS